MKTKNRSIKSEYCRYLLFEEFAGWSKGTQECAQHGETHNYKELLPGEEEVHGDVCEE